jgi:hypothetical protein
MTDAGNSRTPKPFVMITAEHYGSTFAAGCEVSSTARGFRLSGQCPRCEDEMSYDRVMRYFKASRRGAVVATPSRAESDGLVRVLCTCKEDHPGCPDDDQGCGAYWTVEVSAE